MWFVRKFWKLCSGIGCCDGSVDELDELPLDGEAEVIDTIEINDEEPEPVEVTDLDGFHADAEVEDAPQLVDGEPAAIEVSDDDLQ